ncbi:uncharacterized protein LOC112017131 [Quercus suber]|uniref:uncharacterized protein LOC112017131 n=1 Tax=Quercus suber TaxID=58331 RepID=UPI000CE1D7C8|nr:uncharacterized protein LOC112017131 [Quercus suber]
MGRSMHKFSHVSPPYSGEEKMLLQLDLAGKVLYLLTLIILLLLYLRKWKRNRGGGRRHVQTTNRVNVVRGDNGGDTIRGQIARRFRANVAGGEVRDTTGGQHAGEVRFDVAGDDDGATINGQIARRVRANVAVGEVRDTTGGQYAGEVHFDFAGDDDVGSIDGEIALGRTSLAATMPFEFN